MAADEAEVARRTKAALAAIKRTFGTEEGEFGATLFATHHVNELDATFWQKHLGCEKPDPGRVLDILELRSHWGAEGDDGIEVFDFTLPNSITNYVISVRFDEAGEVEDISMES